MEFYQKLPRNKKEFPLFVFVISVISVCVMAPLVTCFELGFQLAIWKAAFRAVPAIWVAVIALVLITYIPAQKLTGLIVAHDDSFRAHVMIDALCTVFLMSIFMTVIGSWIGSGHISMDPIHHFFFKWPRNFTLAFLTEAFIAQPIARFVMLKFHEYTDSKAVA